MTKTKEASGDTTVIPDLKGYLEQRGGVDRKASVSLAGNQPGGAEIMSQFIGERVPDLEQQGIASLVKRTPSAAPSNMG